MPGPGPAATHSSGRGDAQHGRCSGTWGAPGLQPGSWPPESPFPSCPRSQAVPGPTNLPWPCLGVAPVSSPSTAQISFLPWHRALPQAPRYACFISLPKLPVPAFAIEALGKSRPSPKEASRPLEPGSVLGCRKPRGKAPAPSHTEQLRLPCCRTLVVAMAQGISVALGVCCCPTSLSLLTFNLTFMFLFFFSLQNNFQQINTLMHPCDLTGMQPGLSFPPDHVIFIIPLT